MMCLLPENVFTIHSVQILVVVICIIRPKMKPYMYWLNVETRILCHHMGKILIEHCQENLFLSIEDSHKRGNKDMKLEKQSCASSGLKYSIAQ